MKALSASGAWILTLAVTALGILVTAFLGFAGGQDQIPPFLKGATYTTSARCKACHPVISAAWPQSRHAKLAEAFPWEKPAAEGGQPLPEGQQAPAELVYRHVTGYRPAEGGWAEKGVGCEACHGPGSAHVAGFHGGPRSRLVNKADLTTPEQKVSLCGRCHGQYSVGEQRYAADFLPGMDLFQVEGFKLDAPAPGQPFQELNQLLAGRHFRRGVDCLTCHDPHGGKATEHQLRRPVGEVCVSCHAHRQVTMANHAPQAPEGATCATCHLPDGQHQIITPAVGE